MALGRPPKHSPIKVAEDVQVLMRVLNRVETDERRDQEVRERIAFHLKAALGLLLNGTFGDSK